MKIGETWRLLKHHEYTLNSHAKKAGAEAGFVRVVIIKLGNDMVVVKDADEDCKSLGLTWKRGAFVEAYEKERS